MLKKIAAAILIAAALVLAAALMPVAPLYAAAPNAPDAETAPVFSGVWVRTGEPMFDPIPGATEGKPVARLEVDSKDAEEIMAGNWDNPMLQPWSRDVVKKNAESEIALKHVYQAD